MLELLLLELLLIFAGDAGTDAAQADGGLGIPHGAELNIPERTGRDLLALLRVVALGGL